VNLQDLLAQLNEAQQAAQSSTGDAIEKIDLGIAILTIKRAIQFKGFDALKALDAVALPDLGNLPQLVNDLRAARQHQEKFNSLLTRILNITKRAVTPLGIVLP
jgi:hypothetical protein